MSIKDQDTSLKQTDENQGEQTRANFLDITAALGGATGRNTKASANVFNWIWRRGPFSSLTGKIIGLNLIALGILVGGVLYLNQFREGLIDTRIQSLSIQAKIMAGAIGEASGPEATVVDKAVATQILRRLVVPTKTRARLYDARGHKVADSRRRLGSSEIITSPLPAPGAEMEIIAFKDRMLNALQTIMPGQSYPAYIEIPPRSDDAYGEVIAALNGLPSSAVRQNSQRELILSVAVPVQRFKVILGGLMLTTHAGDIDRIVRQERQAILVVAAIAFLVTVLLSLVLAGTIAQPIHKLVEAIDEVRTHRGDETSIPDFSDRGDEIGDLSVALHDMTGALYERIDAIERFAADVSHELKNPLTSLRSAVETLDVVKTDEQRERLLEIIRQDVGRLDRLISDISEASRLDAELSRGRVSNIDLGEMAIGLGGVYNDMMNKDRGLNITFHVKQDDKLIIAGIETRLEQVFRNLIDNAISFSPDGGEIRISVGAAYKNGASCVQVSIEDEGPGIPSDNLDNIFERFYTERPENESFGLHSGLGLNICRQIVTAHGGDIHAENRSEDWSGGGDKVLGARFVIDFPASRIDA
jgi:two-component system sensor histidine kinase ChvG